MNLHSNKVKLLHYGLQRSGTNYLETLMEKNFKVEFLNNNTYRNSPLQKHFRLYDQKQIIPEPAYQNDLIFNSFSEFESSLQITPNFYIVISKDPYSWLLSYQNWAKKCNWPKMPHHYIEEYNLFYRKWLEFSRETQRIFFVKYIDLLNNKMMTLKYLKDHMRLSRKLSSFFDINEIKEVPVSEPFHKDNRQYYIDQKYLDQYSQAQIDEINNLLDSNLVESLGYGIL